MRHLKIAGAALLALTVNACGAVLHGTRQNIDVQSSPSGAKVDVGRDGGIYTTPSTISLERKNSYVLTFSAPGYAPSTLNIHNSLGTGTVIADVVLTGLIGAVVDGITGAWYGLNPEAATVTLTRLGGSQDDADAIHVAVSKSSNGGTATIQASAPNVSVTVRKQ